MDSESARTYYHYHTNNIWHLTRTECNTRKYFQIKSEHQIHEHITCNSTTFKASPWVFQPSKKGRERIQPNSHFLGWILYGLSKVAIATPNLSKFLWVVCIDIGVSKWYHAKHQNFTGRFDHFNYPCQPWLEIQTFQSPTFKESSKWTCVLFLKFYPVSLYSGRVSQS